MARIIVYGAEKCPWCGVTEKWFKENGIEYKYIDVNLDDNARDLIIEKTGQRGIPVVAINGKYTVGYSPEKFKQMMSER